MELTKKQLYKREYRARNRERLKVASKEYRLNLDPELRKKKDRQQTLRKHGLTEVSFDEMRERQLGRCLITQEILTKPVVDHNHLTGNVRGLLSGTANSAIGMLKEDTGSFYRAAAYLSLDRSKRLVYLVGSLRNRGIIQLGNDLRNEGYDIFDNWVAAGPEADDYWQDYAKQRGMTYQEALRSREAQHVFHFDKAYLDLSDAVVLVMPAGRSGHLELGYSVGRGKACFILTDGEPERYDVMPAFADFVVTSLDELKQKLKETFPNG